MFLLVRLLVLAVAALGGTTALPATASDDDALFALPEDLLIGAGVSAVQTEGAWNEGGKAESMVDHAVHSGRLTQLNWLVGNHDVAADSYHRFKEDVAMAAKLKLQLYRFSISWARVLPDADASRPNPVGIAYYHSFIDEILKYNMTPVVTLYHSDHPQILEEQFKSWQDRQVVRKFSEYAALMFSEYSSKVKMWTTINEPNVYCSYWPEIVSVASGNSPGMITEVYPCLHNFLLAHAAAYQAFRQGNYEGTVGFTITTLLSRPRTTAPEDVYASEVFNQMFGGLLLHPLVYGDYPQLVKDVAKDKLPKFTDEEKEMLKNSTDFIGLNVYYGLTVKYRDPSTPMDFFQAPLRQLFREANFLNVAYLGPNEETLNDYDSNVVAPAAMRSAILWTWLNYKKPIIVTENGISGSNMVGVDDMRRAEYYSAFLRSMVATVHEFGAKVIGYCAWSLIDSWEYSRAYNRPYGLVHIDYEGGSLNRTLKKSSSFWMELAERRVVPLVKASSSSSAVAALGMGPALLLAAAASRTLLSR